MILSKVVVIYLLFHLGRIVRHSEEFSEVCARLHLDGYYYFKKSPHAVG